MENQTENYTPRIQTKGNLDTAIEEALKLPTEHERIVAVIETIRCYRNEYGWTDDEQKHLFEGYEKCRMGVVKIQTKVKEILNNYYFEKLKS